MEDNGLFILSAYFAAPAHSPGYPLWTLLTHGFSYLPFDTVAFRINLSSALYAVLACWFMGRSVYLVTNRTDLAVCAMGILAYLPKFWSQAIVAEVYTLHGLFFLLLLYLCICFDQSDEICFPTRKSR